MHLSDTELRNFKASALAPDELLRADDHLSTCADCRARAVALNQAASYVNHLSALVSEPEIHLSDDELQLFVQGLMEPAAQEAARHHLENCSTCAGQVDDLRNWIKPATVSRSRLRWLTLAAAIMAAVLIPTVLWQVWSGRQRVPPSLSGIETLPPQEQSRVQAALTRGAASLPDFMADVKSSREVLMGVPGNRAETFNLVSPVATGTVSDRPRFEWQLLANADRYTVTILDEQLNPVAQSDAITQSNWTPAVSLPRNRTYVWQVTAYRGTQSTTAPAAPAPPARFHIIAESEANLLLDVEAKHPQSHLLLGILNMQAGVFDAAIRHLNQVKTDDQHAHVAQQSLKHLRELK